MPMYEFECPKHGTFTVQQTIAKMTDWEPCLTFSGRGKARKPCMEDSPRVAFPGGVTDFWPTGRPSQQY